jgi:hypothetical protein
VGIGGGTGTDFKSGGAMGPGALVPGIGGGTGTDFKSGGAIGLGA